MQNPDKPREPDKKYTTKLSRRSAMDLGGSAIASALSGCSDLFNPSTGGPEGTQTPTNDGLAPPTILPGSFGVDTAEFEIYPKQENIDQIQNGGSVEYTVRVKSQPLYGDEKTQIAEQTVTKTSHNPNDNQTHTVSYEFSDDQLNEAQQLFFTLETASQDEGLAYKTQNVLLPFENEAEGEVQLQTNSPYIRTSSWDSPTSVQTQLEVWFNEPEDDYFDTDGEYATELTEENYPTQWYGDYKDLQITMVVQYPVFDTLEEDYEHRFYDYLPEESNGQRETPLVDWAVFNFDVADIEMIESRRWNSWLIQQIERGEYEINEDHTVATNPQNGDTFRSHNDQGGLITTGSILGGNAQETNTPFSQYYKCRYEYEGTISPDRGNVNPIMFAGGRPVMKRWAIEMEESLSNNTNFQSHSTPDYYKATILKAMIGNAPYDFSINSYINSPEELIQNWYENESDEAPIGANCVSATGFFTGLGVHLLDLRVVMVYMSGTFSHIQAGIVDPKLPEGLPSSISDTTGDSRIDEGNEYYDSSYGWYVPVECNYPDAVIGYSQEGRGDEFSLSVRSYADEIEINSHIPVNEDYEPAYDGEILADREPPQNALRFEYTITNPDDVPWFDSN